MHYEYDAGLGTIDNWFYLDVDLVDIKIMITEDMRDAPTLMKVTIYEMREDSAIIRQIFDVERPRKEK